MFRLEEIPPNGGCLNKEPLFRFAFKLRRVHVKVFLLTMQTSMLGFLSPLLMVQTSTSRNHLSWMVISSSLGESISMIQVLIWTRNTWWLGGGTHHTWLRELATLENHDWVSILVLSLKTPNPTPNGICMLFCLNKVFQWLGMQFTHNSNCLWLSPI